MNKVIIYRSVPGEMQYVRAGEFTLQADVAVLNVFDDRFKDELTELAAEGVGPFSLKRMVKPQEGEIFLTSLVESFASSSYWRAVDESEGQSTGN